MEYDPLDLKTREKDKESRELQARLDQESEEDDFKWLMGMKRGRRIVWRLMNQSGVFQLSFHPTAMQMAFKEGYRSYGNRILNLIHECCPELYPTMMKENRNARRDDDASRKHQ